MNSRDSFHWKLLQEIIQGFLIKFLCGLFWEFLRDYIKKLPQDFFRDSGIPQRILRYTSSSNSFAKCSKDLFFYNSSGVSLRDSLRDFIPSGIILGIFSKLKIFGDFEVDSARNHPVILSKIPLPNFTGSYFKDSFRQF